MLFIQFFISTILIGCGFLVKAFPDVIAGYNSLSKEDKAKINIAKLSTFLRNLFIVLGVVSLLLFLSLNFLEFKNNHIFLINSAIILLAIVAGSIWSGNRFKH